MIEMLHIPVETNQNIHIHRSTIDPDLHSLHFKKDMQSKGNRLQSLFHIKLHSMERIRRTKKRYTILLDGLGRVRAPKQQHKTKRNERKKKKQPEEDT